MLKEIPRIPQHPGEPRRRWFYDSATETDLVVWQDEHGKILSFQLFYHKTEGGAEYALRWRRQRGFAHDQVDDGENRPGRYKATPILTPDGAFDHDAVAAKFRRAAAELEPAIADFIYRKLLEYRE